MGSKQSEQAALTRDLQNQLKSIQGQLETLGVGPPKKRVFVAPDGGPTANAHEFLAPHRVPTMLVTREGGDGEAQQVSINKTDFDPEIHTEVGAAKSKGTRRRRAVVAEAQPTVSEHTQDELLTMTMPLLMKLPEIGMLKEAPTKKAELVAAILAVRVDQAE